MMKEILTEEKVKQRWQQMEEMNAIWDCLTERQKGYLDGCMNGQYAQNVGNPMRGGVRKCQVSTLILTLRN